MSAARRLILVRWTFLSPTRPHLHDPAAVARICISTASDEADVQGILDLLIHATRDGDPISAGAAQPMPALARAA